MAIIGNIIKGFIEVRDKLTDNTDPIKAQQEVLATLLKTAQDTFFGIHYGFREILDSKTPSATFATAVPYHDYDKMD